MAFGYYENISSKIKQDMLKDIEYTPKAKDSKGAMRDIYFTLHFLDGTKANIYKGKAKPTRLECVFKALEMKGEIINVL